jgi:hypothetical protein
MPAVLCCLEAFADVPAVTTPLLKFVAEFVFNKSQRLTFDTSSPNGILLFREVRACVGGLVCVCVLQRLCCSVVWVWRRRGVCCLAPCSAPAAHCCPAPR